MQVVVAVAVVQADQKQVAPLVLAVAVQVVLAKHQEITASLAVQVLPTVAAAAAAAVEMAVREAPVALAWSSLNIPSLNS